MIRRCRAPATSPQRGHRRGCNWMLDRRGNVRFANVIRACQNTRRCATC